VLSYEQQHMFSSSPSSPTPFLGPGFSQVSPRIHNRDAKEAENYNSSSYSYFPFLRNHKSRDTSSTLRSRSLSPYYRSRPLMRSVSPVMPQLHATASGSSISTNECTCPNLKARNNVLSGSGTREQQYFDDEDTHDGVGTTRLGRKDVITVTVCVLYSLGYVICSLLLMRKGNHSYALGPHFVLIPAAQGCLTLRLPEGCFPHGLLRQARLVEKVVLLAARRSGRKKDM